MALDSKYALFYYDENDNALVEELSNYLDNTILSIYHFFDVRIKDKIKINIIPKKEIFDDKLMKEFNMTSVPKSSRGFF